jgi:hypothetical protein
VRIKRRLKNGYVSAYVDADADDFLWEIAHDKPIRFSRRQLARYTSYYSTRLSAGGSGTVYKGKLPNGLEVAVKVLHGGVDCRLEARGAVHRGRGRRHRRRRPHPPAAPEPRQAPRLLLRRPATHVCVRVHGTRCARHLPPALRSPAAASAFPPCTRSPSASRGVSGTSTRSAGR